MSGREPRPASARASRRAPRTVEAAAVILARGPDEDPRVFLAERAPTMRFLGGFFAFPGGRRDPGDPSLVATAVRELQEEVGLVVDDPSRLVAAARFVTPPFAPVRFDTVFYLLRLRPDEDPRLATSELVAGGFFEPREAVERWRRGAMRIAPPVLFVLEEIAERGLERGLDRARERGERLLRGEAPEVRFAPGVAMASFATDTVPPATTTNTYLVGEEVLHVVDPAPEEPAEQERLLALVERRLAAGARPGRVLLTHHHADHVGAAALVAGRFGMAVAAHPLTLERVPLEGVPTRPLVDGAAIPLGRAPDGTPGWHLQALHTPGHDRGHLVFLESRRRALIAGDLVSTLSTIVIDPPEGHLATYLESLRRVRSLEPGLAFPAHGPPAVDGTALLDRFLDHRARREAKLAAALDAVEPRTPEELLPIVYDDVAEEVLPWARRSLLAGLEKLVEEGRAREVGGGVVALRTGAGEKTE